MAASLRRAVAPLGSAARGAAAAAAALEGRCALGGAPGDSLLRAAACGLRQLHGAASSSLQGGQPPAAGLQPAGVAACAGPGAHTRGFASAAQPAPAQAQVDDSSNGNGDGSGRVKPRFLLERLGRGKGQPEGHGSGGGGGGQAPNGKLSTWPNRGKASAWPNGSSRGDSSSGSGAPAGSRPPPREGRPQRQPWARHGDESRPRAAPERARGEQQRDARPQRQQGKGEAPERHPAAGGAAVERAPEHGQRQHGQRRPGGPGRGPESSGPGRQVGGGRTTAGAGRLAGPFRRPACRPGALLRTLPL